MLDLTLRVLAETWKILQEASIFLLFGFVLAGALAVLVPKPALVRLFGRGKVRSVLWACAVGAPLPLCSCGVVPAALGLRREGATKGATVSFLISTPETGVDSIAVTYALMDPLIGTVRPVTAVATAITAGLTTNFLDPGANQTPPHIEPPNSAPHHAGMAHAGHQHSHLPGDTAHAGCDHVHEDGAFVHVGRPRPYEAARQIYKYAFRDLLDETSYWLILAIVLSGLIAALVPPDLFDRYLSNDFAAMLVMLFIGIPMYTCASASTPLAAAMVMKGLNPGAALVFLLAGPATSAGSIVVLLKFLGARTVAIYLTSIAVVALLAGTLLDWLYGVMDLDPRATFGATTSFLPAPVKTLGALIVVALLVSSIRRTSPPGEWVGLCRKVAALSGNRLTWRRLGWVGSGTIAVLYLGSGLITVGPGEVALRQRFGRILEPELGPGLHYRLPWPIETHELVATQLVRRLEFGLRDDAPQQLEETALARSRLTIGGPSNPAPEPLRARAVWFQNKTGVQDSFLLTGDANLIDMRFAVQYRVKSAVQFVLAAGDPEALLRSVVAAALRDAVATAGIDEIYTRSRGELERRVGIAVQRALDRHRSGIDLLAVRFLYVHAPEEVHDAFRDVASAQEDKLRTINRAGTFAVEKVNEAKAEAAATLEEALAFVEQRGLRARGDADGFVLQAAAYQHQPQLTRFRLHLEETERALAGPNKVIRPGRGDLESFEMWLASPSAPVERR